MTSLVLPVLAGQSWSGDRVRLAVAAYLARYRGLSREHTASDLRVFLGWCAERGVDRLAARRAHLELSVRWCQGGAPVPAVHRVVAGVGGCGFYRTCVIDGLLEHSPAEWLRRPTVPPESPALGLTHLRFGALLAAARESAKVDDFAVVALLGLLGLRVFEACAADSEDLGEEHGHRVLRVVGTGGKVVLVPLPPAVGRAIDRAVDGRTDGPLLRKRPRRPAGPARRHPPAASPR